jgi:uncharacterized protein YjiS (DUF1127 family)
MTYAPTDANRVGGTSRHSLLSEAFFTAGQLLSDFLEARRGRREIAQLVRSDDAMLADIGIARADVEWALMQPWNADPSLALAKRVDRRKASTRWARAFWAS